MDDCFGSNTHHKLRSLGSRGAEASIFPEYLDNKN